MITKRVPVGLLHNASSKIALGVHTVIITSTQLSLHMDVGRRVYFPRLCLDNRYPDHVVTS